ncbi:MAG: serine hydrolase [Bacteroidia bacterium]|nr:serine hydrolase [Bacteroidia bacterium]
MKKIYSFLAAVFALININGQSLYFPPATGNTWDTIAPQTLGYCQPKIDSLYDFLESQNTKAFILLKDGKIVLEKYFGTHTQTSNWQWASAGKTITSFMTGIAQQEGYLSIHDSASVYLGQGWTSCTPVQEGEITVRHQLTMTSGLDDGVADPYCTSDTCLKYKAAAGTRWAYHNGPYTLLDGVIENATGQTLNNYTTQKLKTPTGMTGLFVPVGYNNVFFSNARSMARFGLLMLNKGNWNGNQIMTDSVYFNEMINTSQTLNKSYGYLWWLNGKQSFMVPGSQLVIPGSLFSNAPADMISALGKDGQFLNVVSSQNLVWIRMGEEPGNSLVPFLLNDDIWAYINELQCAPTGTNNGISLNNSVQLIPNPGSDIVSLKSDKPIAKVEIYNLNGQLVLSENTAAAEIRISIKELQSGYYFVNASLADGKAWKGKLIKY